jgi:hypothetical protein
MHTLLILNPGHFHAALVLRESHPQLSDDIYVYSEAGPDLDRFMAVPGSFNERKRDPTHWRIHVYTGEDYLERLIGEKNGDIVVLAGKNDTRMETIDTLSRAGFSVLADKPWVTTEKALPFLRSAMGSNRPLILDIMSERYEITTILQKRLIGEKEIFGQIRIDTDGSPSVYEESVHHLYKIVNEKPLVRPPWHFDVNIQGEGLIDVSTHLVDMTHWMLFPGAPVDFEKDIELLDARRWPTLVPVEKFRKITGTDHFPNSILHDVRENALSYYCNGDLLYRVKNIPVHIRVVWNLEIPEGGGDTHYSYIKGTRSDLLIRQLPERGFRAELLILPKRDLAAVEQSVKACLDKWCGSFPGLSVTREAEKLLLNIPNTLRTSHEEHFCQVRDAFLEYLDTPTLPPETRPCIVSKYTLLAEARKKALDSPFEPLDLQRK